MSYAQIARAFAGAEYGHAVSGAHDTLPMSEWAESRRDTMTPQTVAANHALHVSDTAANLRATLRPNGFDWDAALMGGRVTLRAFKMEAAARALLAAIGEGEQ